MKYTLITGANKGLGKAMAKVYADRNHNLILTGRVQEELDLLKKELLELNSDISIDIISLDLNEKDSPKKLFKHVEDSNYQIGVLINNAGLGDFEDFLTADLNKQLSMIDVNVRALTEITYLFLPLLIEQKGRIGLIASTAAFQPLPKMAVYGATKSYVKSFGVALNEELKNTGASVTVICPGATESNFFVTSNQENNKLGKMKKPSAEEFALFAYNVIGVRKTIATHGIINNIMAQSTRLLPSYLLAKMAKKVLE
ncbi:MAG: SDR family NAD(P)-dependent oxidoreductase [Patescibacteria group bacterium]